MVGLALSHQENQVFNLPFSHRISLLGIQRFSQPCVLRSSPTRIPRANPPDDHLDSPLVVRLISRLQRQQVNRLESLHRSQVVFQLHNRLVVLLLSHLAYPPEVRVCSLAINLLLCLVLCPLVNLLADRLLNHQVYQVVNHRVSPRCNHLSHRQVNRLEFLLVNRRRSRLVNLPAYLHLYHLVSRLGHQVRNRQALLLFSLRVVQVVSRRRSQLVNRRDSRHVNRLYYPLLNLPLCHLVLLLLSLLIRRRTLLRASLLTIPQLSRLEYPVDSLLVRQLDSRAGSLPESLLVYPPCNLQGHQLVSPLCSPANSLLVFQQYSPL